MRHDDLCCQKVRVLDVVDGLAGGFHAQLVGVHVHGGQLRAGDAGEQRVVEGHDGQVLLDAQPQLAAELFQHHSKDVVTDQHGGGVVRCGEQGFQRPLVGIVQGVDLHTVLFPGSDAVLEQGHLVTPLALCGEQHGVIDPEIRNAAVAHLIKVIGSFLPGKGVVVVDVDGLVRRLRCLAHNDMEQPLVAQIRRHRAVLFGVEQDKPICLCVGHHALDSVQHLGVVLPGDDRVHIPPLVAELPDAADDLEMKGVFVDVPLGGGQNDADGLGKSLHRFSLKIRLVAQLRHDAAHPLFGLPADGRAVLAGAGHRGGRDRRCAAAGRGAGGVLPLPRQYGAAESGQPRRSRGKNAGSAGRALRLELAPGKGGLRHLR